MESLTSKEFFEKLKTDNLKPAFALVGIVKRSDKENEVLYTDKGDFSHWTAIPSSMIESVKIIKNFTIKEISYTVAKLRLQAPANPEAKVLLELLMASAPGEMHHGCPCGEGKCMQGMEHSHCGEHHHCSESMEHNKMHSHCGCGHQHDHCGCGCGQHQGCGCGSEKHFGCH